MGFLTNVRQNVTFSLLSGYFCSNLSTHYINVEHVRTICLTIDFIPLISQAPEFYTVVTYRWKINHISGKTNVEWHVSIIAEVS